MMAANSLLPAAARAALQARPSTAPHTAAALRATLALLAGVHGAHLALSPAFCLAKPEISSAVSDGKLPEPQNSKTLTKCANGNFLSILAPKNVIMTCIRNGILCYSHLVEQYFSALENNARREEEGELNIEPVEFPDTTNANKEVAFKIIRDFGVQWTRRVIARYVRRNFPEKDRAKLLKDVWESAARKAARGWTRDRGQVTDHGGLARGKRICAVDCRLLARTVLRCRGKTVGLGIVVPSLSELIVQFSIVSFDAWSRHTRGDMTAWTRWRRRTLQAILRCGAVGTMSALGAAGAICITGGESERSARWTTAGGILTGDFLANTLVAWLTDAWVARA